MNPTLSAEQPTRYRHGVLGFCCVLSMITYLDRVCISTVMPFLQREFGLSEAEKSYVFGAFTFAYACFEVPSGWLGDRFGPRRTLIRIVLWWSTFTVLTAVIQPGGPALQLGFATLSLSYLGLVVVRFLFGLGEAGAYPNIARAFHNWFPVGERGFAKGTVWMAGRFAGGVTPIIVYAMIQEYDMGGAPMAEWRHTFWIFGGLGVVWCIAFSFWFRDQPEQKAGVNAAEIALIREGDASHHEKLRVPWGKLLTNVNLWLLCLMYFCASYGWYFNITYLPGFLEQQFGLSRGAKWSSGWWMFSIMAGLPLLFGSAACFVGGLLTDTFIRRTGDRKWGRRLFGVVGHGLCALSYSGSLIVLLMFPELAGRTMGVAWLFVLAVGMASFFNDMTMGAAWASCLDIGGRVSGIVAGCMNTVGNLGGFTANILTGQVLSYYLSGYPRSSPELLQASESAWMAQMSVTGNLPGMIGHAVPSEVVRVYLADLHRQSPEYWHALQAGWTLNFGLFTAVYVLAVLLWLRFDATRPVVPPETPPKPETLLPGIDPVKSFKVDEPAD